ncbi:hypothetical protein RAAC3_TM7C00001G0097 [Candidatus Saccharibacteria bacterium RAAC3_TM7_1]|nr:hypothetical protein RAAC3_TM7C00001G0097 [Candidatus Saccharibacteria bacterium RAAC3_TM7_1]HCZ28226.1 hypothetical protein [Candidatus Saccharibacteria bacterium]
MSIDNDPRPLHDNPYEITHDEVVNLTHQLLQENPPKTSDRFVCYRLEGKEPFSDIGRGVERLVLEQTFKNNAAEMDKEYSAYEDQSMFFISFDATKEAPSGVLRIIQNGPAGLKTLHDLQEESTIGISKEVVMGYHDIDDLSRVWDVGTVAVPPEYRSGEGAVSVQLYRAMYLSALENKIDHFISIVDLKPLGKLTGYLGIPFKPLAGTQPFKYLGSDRSQAVYGYVPEFYKKMSQKMRTPRGLLARKALKRLVKGTEDNTLQF